MDSRQGPGVIFYVQPRQMRQGCCPIKAVLGVVNAGPQGAPERYLTPMVSTHPAFVIRQVNDLPNSAGRISRRC